MTVRLWSEPRTAGTAHAVLYVLFTAPYSRATKYTLGALLGLEVPRRVSSNYDLTVKSCGFFGIKTVGSDSWPTKLCPNSGLNNRLA